MAINISESSNNVVESQLTEKLIELEGLLGADVMTLIAPIRNGVDDHVRYAVEELTEKKKRKKLVVIIETPGGNIEVAERIVNTFRRYYRNVEFVIPDSAMSAGTVIVLSGDAIHMDYYSVLGPIDPQVEKNGRLVPALGYLAEYEDLIEKSKRGKLSEAELHFMLDSFDPAELYSYKQARELSISLLEEWLVKYKFKNWKKTEAAGKTVTQAMRKERASEIAKQLNKTDIWRSHSRGISMDVLRKKLKLTIDDFGENEELSDAITVYNRLLRDYTYRTQKRMTIHTRVSFNPRAH